MNFQGFFFFIVPVGLSALGTIGNISDYNNNIRQKILLSKRCLGYKEKGLALKSNSEIYALYAKLKYYWIGLYENIQEDFILNSQISKIPNLRLFSKISEIYF